MRVVHVLIRNFRGISRLDWAVPDRLVCLIGGGDSGKSTILDAIEWTIGPRWSLPVSDADFYDLDVEAPILIEVSVAGLPEDLRTVSTYGKHCRYLVPGTDGPLHDEPPEGESEEVLSVQLSIDRSLDPEWAVVCGDRMEPRLIGARDRRRLGLQRLAHDGRADLRWGRGSALDRLTQSTASAGAAVADAHRAARAHIDDTDLEPLADTVSAARSATPTYGAGVNPDGLRAGMDPTGMTTSASVLGLHDGDVPLTMAGLGTRRLAVLALQAAAVADGGIVVADEIEAGLEPHRLRRLLTTLRTTLAKAEVASPGQVIVTTHSPTAVVELEAAMLVVVRRFPDGSAEARTIGADLQAVVRRKPDALLARSVIVAEGKTEHGLLRGLDAGWCEAGDDPFAHSGVAVVDGGGAAAPGTARDLAKLGYSVAFVVDGDVDINPPVGELEDVGVKVIQWAAGNATEAQLAKDLPIATLGTVLEVVADGWGLGQVRGNLAHALGLDAGELGEAPSDWLGAVDDQERLRDAVASTLRGHSYLKKHLEVAERVGATIAPSLEDAGELGEKLLALRAWSRGD